MDKIKIGWSEVDFSPEKGTKISLAGQFYERITDEVESPITATAFALECGKEQMIICSCDLVSIGENLNKLVKEKVCKEIDLSPDKIIISAIHTHTSYVYSRKEEGKPVKKSSLAYLQEIIPEDMQYVPLVSNEKCLSPVDSLNFLVEKISQAIVEAWNNRSEGYYQNAFGRAVVGHCRRVCYDDGSAMWGDTNSANFTELEAGNDSGIELIYTFDKDNAYKFSSDGEAISSSNSQPYGSFSISGVDLTTESETKNGVTSYSIPEGHVSIQYTYSDTMQ